MQHSEHTQHTATHWTRCTTLQHTATHCNTLIFIYFSRDARACQSDGGGGYGHSEIACIPLSECAAALGCRRNVIYAT